MAGHDSYLHLFPNTIQSKPRSTVYSISKVDTSCLIVLFNDIVNCKDSVTLVMAEWSMEHRWNNTVREKPKYPERTSPSATLSTTCTGLRRERPATTRTEEFDGQIYRVLTSMKLNVLLYFICNFVLDVCSFSKGSVNNGLV